VFNLNLSYKQNKTLKAKQMKIWDAKLEGLSLITRICYPDTTASCHTVQCGFFDTKKPR